MKQVVIIKDVLGVRAGDIHLTFFKKDEVVTIDEPLYEQFKLMNAVSDVENCPADSCDSGCHQEPVQAEGQQSEQTEEKPVAPKTENNALKDVAEKHEKDLKKNSKKGAK